MAFEKKRDLSCESAVALGGIREDKKTGKKYKNPTQFEGYYLGFREVDTGYDKPSKLHIFQTQKGQEGVWGKTNMDSQLSDVEPGTKTKVIFTGLLPPTKRGRKPMSKYDVFVDKEDVLEGFTPIQASEEPTGDSEEGLAEEMAEEVIEEEVYEEEGSLEEEEPAADETTAARAKAPKTLTTPSPDRQAAAQRLVAGTKKSA